MTALLPYLIIAAAILIPTYLTALFCKLSGPPEIDGGEEL